MCEYIIYIYLLGNPQPPIRLPQASADTTWATAQHFVIMNCSHSTQEDLSFSVFSGTVNKYHHKSQRCITYNIRDFPSAFHPEPLKPFLTWLRGRCPALGRSTRQMVTQIV